MVVWAASIGVGDGVGFDGVAEGVVVGVTVGIGVGVKVGIGEGDRVGVGDAGGVDDIRSGDRRIRS